MKPTLTLQARLDHALTRVSLRHGNRITALCLLRRFDRLYSEDSFARAWHSCERSHADTLLAATVAAKATR